MTTTTTTDIFNAMQQTERDAVRPDTSLASTAEPVIRSDDVTGFGLPLLIIGGLLLSGCFVSNNGNSGNVDGHGNNSGNANGQGNTNQQPQQPSRN